MPLIQPSAFTSPTQAQNIFLIAHWNTNTPFDPVDPSSYISTNNSFGSPFFPYRLRRVTLDRPSSALSQAVSPLFFPGLRSQMKTIIHGASLIAVRPRAEELFLLQRQTDFTMRRYTIVSIECARGENVFSRRSELSVGRVGEVFVDQGGKR